MSFENLNLYSSVTAIVADSPSELASILSEIKAPIKIVGFTSFGTKQVCYVLANGFKIKNESNSLEKKETLKINKKK